MRHYIEDDLRWFEMGIPGMVLVWETEAFLARWAEFDRWLAEHPEERPDQRR